MTLALQAQVLPGVFRVSLQIITSIFSLERTEIHALLDENGASKSTLMNILYGFYQPDEGESCIRMVGKCRLARLG